MCPVVGDILHMTATTCQGFSEVLRNQNKTSQSGLLVELGTAESHIFFCSEQLSAALGNFFSRVRRPEPPSGEIGLVHGIRQVSDRSDQGRARRARRVRAHSILKVRTC